MTAQEVLLQRETAGRGGEAGSRPGPKMCVHMFSGEVSYKLCTWRYDCVHCPYDLMLEEARWQEHNRAGHGLAH